MSDMGSDRQGGAANVVTRCASEHLAQDSTPTGSMLTRYAAVAGAVLVLAIGIRPILAIFMTVASIGFR